MQSIRPGGGKDCRETAALVYASGHQLAGWKSRYGPKDMMRRFRGSFPRLGLLHSALRREKWHRFLLSSAII